MLRKIETSLLTCRTNQLPGFNMRRTLVVNGLKKQIERLEFFTYIKACTLALEIKNIMIKISSIIILLMSNLSI